ncbi:MAG: YitT family protein [Bacteroidales bacterium]
MAFTVIDKTFSKAWFRNYAFIVIGALFMAAGYVFFITPNKIIPGGVIGLSVIIHYATEGMFAWAPKGLPVGIMALLMNIPLVYFGIKTLGPRYGIKTILGFVLVAVFIDGLTIIWGYEPMVEGDMLLSAIYGGVLIGFGLGLIFKSKASSGGTDILAMIISKYTSIQPGRLLIYLDTVIIMVGLLIFKDWEIPLYALIVIFLVGKVIDTTLQGPSYQKSLFIITNKYDEIRDKIIHDLNRGGTALHASGMFHGDEKKMIFVNVTRREMAILEEFIKSTDPDAFLTVINAHEIIGKGFKSISDL